MSKMITKTEYVEISRETYNEMLSACVKTNKVLDYIRHIDGELLDTYPYLVNNLDEMMSDIQRSMIRIATALRIVNSKKEFRCIRKKH